MLSCLVPRNNERQFLGFDLASAFTSTVGRFSLFTCLESNHEWAAFFTDAQRECVFAQFLTFTA